MPVVEIQHVVSCSSADKNNPAENLLKSEGSYKWKCATVGEKKVVAVLQLSKSSQIHSIDIGNEGSAFVEVLVGKATAAADTDFEVLLVASSFMTPLESRNGTNRNGVRMFGAEKLNKTTASEKWDRVKIVCTQPFSKTSQYGLSFVKFHSPPSSEDTETPKPKKFGSFTLKDNDEEEGIQIGSLFAKRSSPSEPPPLTGPAAMRAATRLADEQVKTTPVKIVSPFSSTSSTKVNAPASSNSSSYKKEDQRKRRADSPPHHSKPKAARPSHGDSNSEEEPRKKVIKAKLVDDKQQMKKTPSKPPVKFSALMSKVTFVMSGFQNPSRGQLRDQALEMGAKYKSDWAPGCTHLICAFTNTPKYQQVAGKGKIVTKNWIIDSHRKKELQPWKKYRLGKAKSPPESSESEEEEEESSTRKPDKIPEERKFSKEVSKEETVSSSSILYNKKGAIKYEDSASDSGGDTEDELRKATERSEREKLASKNSPKSEIDEAGGITDKTGIPDDQAYDQSTDEDEAESMTKDNSKDNSSDSGFPDLPDFFTDKHFFFYGEFPVAEQRLLTRYIAAYNGELEDYMSKRVKYVITNQKWDSNFDEALNENAELVFVKPKWLVSCHSKLKLMPFQPYIVVPQ